MSTGNTAWKSAAALALVAVLGTTLLATVDHLTRERIDEQERRIILEQLGQIIPRDHDPKLLDDRFTFQDETHFPGGQEVIAWRARRGGDPLAVVLRFAALNGYNGRIELLAGINFDGSLRGVRVISHKETPGLGDGIERRKSDWILSFNGKRIGDPPAAAWAVKRDGGEFDQFTGATITPRAIVGAVRRALQYYEANRETLYSSPSSGPAE